MADVLHPCSRCKTLKPRTAEHFARWPARPDGLSPDCRTCRAAQNRAWRVRNLARVREKERRSKARDPERYERLSWAGHLRRKYGITEADYLAIVERAGGRCESCRAAPPHGRRLHLDHDHTTGLVRGLLCGPCNRALGLLRDDPARVEGLLAYRRPKKAEVG